VIAHQLPLDGADAPIDPAAPPRLGRGSDATPVGGGALRRAIARAVARGDLPGIAAGYEALAAALAAALQLAAAIRELEEGIDVVTAAQGLRGAGTPPSASGLAAALAALLELAGESAKARQALAVADGRATLVEAPGLR
jgi:hypothetical protein